jgi:sugar fermentation stimulation protein A
MTMNVPNRVPGSYILVLNLRQHLNLEIGSLGQISFKPGWYLYVGSAISGLKARIRRHFNKKKLPHWHIDYLSNKLPIITIVLFISDKRLECLIADNLKRELNFIPGFGCSDCECSSHLFFTESEPQIQACLEGMISVTNIDTRILKGRDIKIFLK